ncbi:mediator of DNA damage checkpoint protein 1-like [Sylvia atricapilla]|uniref:mediator of DNA damage checkpoint protein 1-like n=1 Tax=Sylvia atricapilla TaxID=48155 RepID=UPI003399F47D
MAREGTLEDPPVPPDVGTPQKHLLCPQKAPDVVREGPDPDVNDTKTPEVAQNTSDAPDVAAEPPNPDVLWAKNGHRTLLVDSHTDVEEVAPNPDVGPQSQLKITQNVPETPDVGLKTLNPDASCLKNGCGMLVVESDTDVEDEKADPDVDSPKRLKITPNVLETPDVAAKTQNPDVPGPKMWCGMELVDSDTDVEADPDVQPPKRLKVTQNVPGITDVKVETPNPAVQVTRLGHWTLLVESDTDEEGEEEDPDVQPQKWLRMTQNVPETPHVAAKAPHPDVSGPKLHHQMLLGDSDTDVEDEVNPDLQSPKSLQVTQSVAAIPDVEVGTPNPAVERPKIRHQMLVVDSDTDVDEDPDVEPTKRLKGTQHVPETPGVQLGTPNPDVSTPRSRCQVLLVDSDTDVEEDPDVEPLKQFRVTQNIPESPDVAAETPSPDVSGPEIRCQTFLVDSNTDAEEEEVNPDVVTLRKLKMTPDVPESPDVGLKSPNPDGGRHKNGCRALLGDSETDVEEDEASPDVWPAKRQKMTQNVPETPDVSSQTPNPAVGGSWRGRRVLLKDSETDVEEEADPDVRLTKRRKITQNVQPIPPNPNIGRLQGTQNSAKIPGVEVEEEEWDLDVATQLFLPPNPDVKKAGADPDVGRPKRLKATQKPPKIPDVEGTPDPDVKDESDPDVATQPFLPSPDVGSPETVRKAPEIPDVEGLSSLDPDVATQLFLPPDPDVVHHPNPDVLGLKQLRTALDEPRIPDVRAAPPDPDEVGEEDFDVATQLFLCPNPDVEGERPLVPDVGSPQSPQTHLNSPKIPDVEADTPKPDVEGPCPDLDVATQLFLTPNPDVEGERPSDPGVWSPQTPPNLPEIPDVEAKPPKPDVEGPAVPCPDPDVATQLFLPPDPAMERKGPSDSDVQFSKTPQTPRKLPEIPDVEVETSNADVEGTGQPCPDPDVATQLFPPPNPDVEHPESCKTALKETQIPDVESEPPNPDVGRAPGTIQEEAEALPTPQVRRSQRLAESRGGVVSSDSTPKGRDQDHQPRPQRRRHQAGVGLAQAPPSMSIKGNGRGSVSALPPQQEEPAGGAKRSLRPRPLPGPAHIRVLFTGLVASPALLVALGTLGGTEATSVRDCSHLVTDGIRRTLKFLCALGKGIPIVTPQWLLQSSHSGRPLSPGPFLPQDPSPERRFGFRLRTALARARAQPLLQGYQVHVTPSVQPCPKDMRDIITCCGGTFLPQLPQEHTPRVLVISCPQDQGDPIRPRVLVISCPQDRSLWAPAVAARLPLLSAELLLSGVLRQRLDIAQDIRDPHQGPRPRDGHAEGWDIRSPFGDIEAVLGPPWQQFRL